MDLLENGRNLIQSVDPAYVPSDRDTTTTSNGVTEARIYFDGATIGALSDICARQPEGSMYIHWRAGMEGYCLVLRSGLAEVLNNIHIS